ALLKARVHLHLARVELADLRRDRIPGREGRIAGRQLRVRREDTELLLPREGLLAQRVPARVEVALVPVGPLLRHVVRRMAGAGREVHEERLVGSLCLLPAGPFDGGVRPGRRQVEALLGRHADDRVVLREEGIPVTVLAPQEAPEVVEAEPVGPAVEGTGGTLLIVRGQVPLAEGGRAVAVVAQDLGERRRAARPQRVVARVAAVRLGDRAEADAVVIAAGAQRSTGGGPQRGAGETVIAQPGRGPRAERRRG